jgi:hypothetical protein
VIRYRRLDENGDYVFGRGSTQFYVDQTEAVAQAVDTRLALWVGQWFLNLSEGMPWRQSVVGRQRKAVADAAIRDRIARTLGVLGITDYDSHLDLRELTVHVGVSTVFGPVDLTRKYAIPPSFELDVTPLDSGGGLM